MGEEPELGLCSCTARKNSPVVRCEEGCGLLPSWQGRDSKRAATNGEGQLEQLGQLQEEPGFFCGTETSVPLGRAPGMSVTPKPPQSSVCLDQLLLGNLAQQDAGQQRGTDSPAFHKWGRLGSWRDLAKPQIEP